MDPLLETEGRYEKLENLGAGSFGFVVLAKNKLGKKTAIKVISHAVAHPVAVMHECDPVFVLFFPPSSCSSEDP